MGRSLFSYGSVAVGRLLCVGWVIIGWLGCCRSVALGSCRYLWMSCYGSVVVHIHICLRENMYDSLHLQVGT